MHPRLSLQSHTSISNLHASVPSTSHFTYSPHSHSHNIHIMYTKLTSMKSIAAFAQLSRASATTATDAPFLEASTLQVSDSLALANAASDIWQPGSGKPRGLYWCSDNDFRATGPFKCEWLPPSDLPTCLSFKFAEHIKKSIGSDYGEPCKCKSSVLWYKEGT